MKQKPLHAILIALMLCLCLTVCAQQRFVTMSYNCENLFDTIHNEGKDDYEFLPESKSHRWTSWRMNRKLNRVAQVVLSADSVQPSDLVCLIEVESDSALTWLIQRTQLRRLGYRYVVTHSADKRGVNVAFLYQPFTFGLLSVESIRHPSPKVFTRDVLHMTGRLVTGDTIDVYGVHLPSKLGGKTAADNRRELVRLIMHNIDSVCLVRQKPSIMVMGDFNDGVQSEIAKMFAAPSGGGVGLVNMMADEKPGTYKYKGQWDTIDQYFVSPNLLRQENGMYTSARLSEILVNRYLLEDDAAYGGLKPFRTYLGYKYNNGYSDHLPIVVKYEFGEDQSFPQPLR